MKETVEKKESKEKLNKRQSKQQAKESMKVAHKKNPNHIKHWLKAINYKHEMSDNFMKLKEALFENEKTIHDDNFFTEA